jgi:hypothetical protein
MTTASNLAEIAARLRHIVLSKWTDNAILNHVKIELPAPVFDQVVMDLKSELSMVQDLGFKSDMTMNFITFGGIRIYRKDGVYWRVRDDALGQEGKQS